MKKYLITSRDYYKENDANIFKKNLVSALKYNINFACFRENLEVVDSEINIQYQKNNNTQTNTETFTKNLESNLSLNANLMKLLTIFMNFAYENNIYPFINFNILQKKIFHIMIEKFTIIGIHLKGNNINDISYFKKNYPNNMIFFSAHTKEEIEFAINLGADFVTISPIFYDKGKYKKLGTCFLEKLNYKNKIFALGGVNENNILKLHGINMAGISFFLNS